MRSIFPNLFFSEAENLVLKSAENNYACQNALSIIKGYDFKTYYHSVGVAQLVSAITHRTDLIDDEDIIEPLVTAGFEHDFGKVMVAKEVVSSSKEFTKNEWEQMKLHPIGSFFLSLASHPDEPLIPSLGLRHHTLQTGLDAFGDSRSYPANEDVKQIESYYLTHTISSENRALGTLVLTVADQIEARMPIPRLNSHPYGKRSKDTGEVIIEKVRAEITASPYLETGTKAVDKALAVAKEIMRQTVEYHGDNRQKT